MSASWASLLPDCLGPDASKWTLNQVQGDAGGKKTAKYHHNVRHPELVSGSIVQLPSPDWRQTQSNCQIIPMRIPGVNQIDLPSAAPVFQLFLARNRNLHRAEYLKMHQRIYGVFGRVAGRQTVTMLRQALEQIRCNANVERAVVLACKYVYAWGFFLFHCKGLAGKWILKQVQDDVNFGKNSHFISAFHIVTLNLFQGPSRVPELASA